VQKGWSGLAHFIMAGEKTIVALVYAINGPVDTQIAQQKTLI
jgi:hypothetical protein